MKKWEKPQLIEIENFIDKNDKILTIESSLYASGCHAGLGGGGGGGIDNM